MEQFRSDYGLNEQNFSLCYYDTVTGEEYRYNDGCFMVAASTFKLPLNLYYYELEQSGPAFAGQPGRRHAPGRRALPKPRLVQQ